MLIYNSQINPQTRAPTPTNYSFCPRVFLELHTDLWVSAGAAVTGSGYSGPRTLTPHQAGSRPAGDPDLLTVPASSKAEPRCPCRSPLGKCYYDIRKSPPLARPKAPGRHIRQFVSYARKSKREERPGLGLEGKRCNLGALVGY